MYDQAFCGFGHRSQGLVLRNETTLDVPTSIAETGRGNPNAGIGWWSVYFPWDHKALLRYRPAELTWFLLKQMLAIQPWESLISWCDEYGVLERVPSDVSVLLG